MAEAFTIERLAADVGIDPDSTDCATLVNYGDYADFTNDGDSPDPGDGIPVHLTFPWTGFGTWPRYNAADATRTITAVWQDYSSNTGGSVEIPWNDDWVWAEEGDAGMLIDLDGDGLHGEGFELWRTYGVGDIPRPWVFEAFDGFQDCWARGWRPDTDHLLVGQIHHREAGLANVGLYQGRGGANAPKMAGILTADELAAAVASGEPVGHALSLVGVNFDNGPNAVTAHLYAAPGNRVEHTVGAEVPGIPTSPDARLFREGRRFRRPATDEQITDYLDDRGLVDPLRSTVETILRTLRDYGWVMWETGTGQPQFECESIGPGYPSSDTFAALGITSSEISAGLIAGWVTSPDDIEAVLPEALIVEVDEGGGTIPPPEVPDPVAISRIRCLGVGLYTMNIVRRRSLLGRGGPFLPGDELDLIGGNWTRKLGASAAGVTFAADATCCEAIEALVDLAAIELELWREQSTGRAGGSPRVNEMVWAGPCTELLDNRDGTCLLTAADSSYYITDERVTRPRSWTATDLATIFTEAIRDALVEDNPGLTITATPTGITGDRSVAVGDAKMLGTFLAEIARTAVDWTVAGREWRVGGRQIDRASILPFVLHDEHFADKPKIRVSRSAMGTRWAVRGDGVVGTYGGPRDTDGILIEKVLDQNGIIDQASADAAARTTWDRTHEPVTVIDENANAKLDPDIEVDIQTLVPGMGVRVVVGDCLRFDGLMRLEGVSVDFAANTEDVKVSLQPPGTGVLA